VFAQQEDTRQVKDQLHALPVHPARMPLFILLLYVPNVATMNINRVPMLPNVVRSKVVITVLAPQQKSFVQPVKLDLVEINRVPAASLVNFKMWPETARASFAQWALETMVKGPRVALAFRPVPTKWVAKGKIVRKDTNVKEKIKVVNVANVGRTHRHRAV
jgi:hypothetical protein